MKGQDSSIVTEHLIFFPADYAGAFLRKSSDQVCTAGSQKIKTVQYTNNLFLFPWQ